ncbi:Dol-P-Man:Man(5)GlcNAc(2)-PP-Dol alpha-1,3-mannosyltransferase [Gracilariopsis chorda]|uniref:dolichyl-P-Man:Man5GlcNAc2-PP-dolichol alpha-1,3-mannosyltransferase n=1 Tax=Gracilariopsis chorda TaxID=448386 RepID=A0A2V3IRH9_9FLOR|nr:Dol-P-Man:Man(5)GlcNAc(2)-PP-Dol alpha-1,3-mannosyltransferase [Gracilariopsis chorda]|eukprot:PXF43760.1 Dol-P-Man:Man(5)GlcNAc(2)-PP-Dol alpha-1,3-mannosyltransferase [Gracilariopsis chorda]
MQRPYSSKLSNFADSLDELLRKRFFLISTLLVALNLSGCILVISRVPYTEVDWVAYMEEVAGVVEYGELDYKQLRGGTGPLVYPAGFVYFFSLLYKLTDHGNNIFLAQYIFAVFHSVTLALVLCIYYKCHTHVSPNGKPPFPLYIVGFLFLSRRIVSLFVLRLFNDGVQAMIMYIAVLLFMRNRWTMGCLIYSFSVSIKMNALLYAPGLAVLLCQARGFGGFASRVIAICLGLQITLGLPFLFHAPTSYLSRAFELTREFLYRWSVNGAFLSEDLFLDKKLAVSLLSIHLFVLILFGHYRWTANEDGGIPSLIIPQRFDRKSWLQFLFKDEHRKLRPFHVAAVLFSSNFIGIVFARTLHYQFYAWYAHTIPFLVWGGPYPWVVKTAIIFAIEIVFNIFPPSSYAAILLNLCHVSILISLWREARANRTTIYEASDRAKVK